MLTAIRIAIIIVFVSAIAFTASYFLLGTGYISDEVILERKLFYEKMAKKYPSPYNDRLNSDGTK